MIAALGALIFLSRCWSDMNPTRLKDETQSTISRDAYGFENFRVAYDYVIGVVLSQGILIVSSFLHLSTGAFQTGGCCFDVSNAVRFAAASWCLACFVLVSAYGSTLISFVTSPIVHPLIESIHDIPKKGNVKVITDRGHTLDNTIMVRKMAEIASA